MQSVAMLQQQSRAAAYWLSHNKLQSFFIFALVFFYREPLMGIIGLLVAPFPLLYDVIRVSICDISYLFGLILSSPFVSVTIFAIHLLRAISHMYFFQTGSCSFFADLLGLMVSFTYHTIFRQADPLSSRPPRPSNDINSQIEEQKCLVNTLREIIQTKDTIIGNYHTKHAKDSQTIKTLRNDVHFLRSNVRALTNENLSYEQALTTSFRPAPVGPGIITLATMETSKMTRAELHCHISELMHHIDFWRDESERIHKLLVRSETSNKRTTQNCFEYTHATHHTAPVVVQNNSININTNTASPVDNTRCEQMLSDKARIEKVSNDLSLRITVLEARNFDLVNDSRRLHSDKENLNTIISDLREANATLTDSNTKNTTLQTTIAKQDNTIAELQSTKKDLTAKNTDFETKNANLTRKNAHLTNTNASLALQNTSNNTSTNTALATKSAENQRLLEQYNRTVVNSNAQVSNLNTQISNLNATILQQQTVILQRETTINAANARIAVLESNINTYEELVQSMRVRGNAYESEANTQIQELEQKNTELRAKTQNLHQENMQLYAQRGQLQNQYHGCRTKEEFKSEVKMAEARMEAMKDKEIVYLKAHLQCRHNDAARLHAEAHSVSVKLHESNKKLEHLEPELAKARRNANLRSEQWRRTYKVMLEEKHISDEMCEKFMVAFGLEIAKMEAVV